MRPLVFAHRGFSSKAPENTMAAFRLGWESGADGVECDVHLTADGEIACIHDYDTGRVSDRKLIVSESNWRELASLDVGGWKASKWSGEPIPTLRALLAAIPENTVLVIELKCGPEVVAPLVEVIDESRRDQDSLVVISFIEDSLIELKRVRPKLRSYWLSDLDVQKDGSVKPSIEEILGTLDRLGVDGFGGQSGEGISQSLVDALKAKGYALNVWTVDDAEEARRMKRIGVSSVTSNNPRATMDALEG
ncbi:MAG: glycerophosphodiester phosphodiesterase family protein [Opitutaceae bacterium]|nr:glycerophosphodiester phosphodiesterase family protein [Opitutaceae bacterium]